MKAKVPNEWNTPTFLRHVDRGKLAQGQRLSSHTRPCAESSFMSPKIVSNFQPIFLKRLLASGSYFFHPLGLKYITPVNWVTHQYSASTRTAVHLGCTHPTRIPGPTFDRFAFKGFFVGVQVFLYGPPGKLYKS